MVHVRPPLVRLQSYVPGRKAPGATLLASNECPYGLLPGVAARVADMTTGLSRYPDMGAARLLEALATHHGVTPDRIAVGAGSSEVCGQLLHTVAGPGTEVVYGWRSFEAYPILTTVAGAAPIPVPLRDHVQDLDAMAAAITELTRLVFVCNPNNPTSTAIDEAALRAFIDRMPDHVLVVVDEAYREYADPSAVPDALELFGDRPNVVVLRTFSKAYGLAGLRVGYCVGAPELIEQVRKTQTPFSVSALAQEAAIAALGEQEEVARRASLTITERHRVTRELRRLGYVLPGSHANFVWLPLGEDSTAFTDHCLDNGVILRAFPTEGVRITIGLPEENSAFLALAETWRARTAE
ncbi:histidinol-phosphate transaminase [Actinomadura sp. CNU-125]|uniref:histidinol-phosphate transaminase n=1 Tax=Actinomadura sp. CNU-125 TaxID=1904961 RepID=UPI000967185A|nr:histidinol-phosphate transaminase [Actinomadura sp. CNU-125]OLT13311.1 histidinol-phosphate transaminase [Actinomadura sp. CNU-125]